MGQNPAVRTFTAAVVVAVIAIVGMRAQPVSTPPSFARVEAAILDEMQKAGIPGAAVALVVGDRVVWTKGFGVANVETGAPVAPDTLFQIGSVTKSFTAAPLMAAVPSLLTPALLSTTVFPHFAAPAPTFQSDGQDRPPRSI